MQCVILSGGLGTRLGELGRNRPKHLVPVLDRPFAHRQLEWLASQGVTDVVECIGHLGDEIVASIGDGAVFGVSVTYSDDGTRPDGSPARPGTGGALLLARRRGLLRPRFLVMYGDSWLRLSVADLWRRAEGVPQPATMAVIDNHSGSEPSNVRLDGGLVRYAKPAGSDDVDERATHIDYGISVLTTALLDRIDRPGSPSLDLADAMKTWSEAGSVAPYEASEPYDEVGTPAGVERLERSLLATRRSG